MSLSIYDAPNPETAFSEDGTFTKPISLTVDGATGATITKKFFIRNDDVSKFYTTITLTPVVSNGLNIVTGTVSTFYWKLLAQESQPLEDQWNLLSAGNSISFENIGSSGNGDITTYQPFWLRVNVPRGADVNLFENVSLEINAIENNV